MDYAGSFDKDEVTEYLTTKKGFRIQGSIKDADRTILDNTDQVGNNCLTYMKTADDLTTRCKIYNKMVQMLESKSVRETAGQHVHWKDWVCQKDTRLANARDLAKDRGLTRAEVTFYCKDRVPSDNLMEGTLLRITEYVPPAIDYSTPFSEISRAYCDCMLHSLVVIDRTRDQWRNYYGLRPGEPGGPQPQWAKWGPPGLGDRAKTLARTSDMLQCRFLTIRIL
jgi:hypothetical protein